MGASSNAKQESGRLLAIAEAVFLALIVVALGVGGWALLATSGDPAGRDAAAVAPTPTPRRSALVTPRPTVSPTPVPASPVVPAVTPGPTPPSEAPWSGTEEFLLAGVSRDLRDHCVRAPELPAQADGGIQCRPPGGPVEAVGLYAFPTDSALLAHYEARLAKFGVRAADGSCRADRPGHGVDAQTGLLMGCYHDTVGAGQVRLVLPAAVAGRSVYIGAAGWSSGIAEVASWVAPAGGGTVMWTSPTNGRIAVAPPPPTPRATPAPAVVTTYPGEWFGDRVTLTTFPVHGSTPHEILNSWGENGPYSDWIGGAAAGMTQWRYDLRFEMDTSSGECDVVPWADPPVVADITVVLPAWSQPSAVAPETVAWWQEELDEVATHEQRHVEIVQEALPALNAAVELTCEEALSGLDEVRTQVRIDNCLFDMDEYGREEGLSVEACLVR